MEDGSSGHPLPSVIIPALRTVGNIVTGDDIQTQTYSIPLQYNPAYSVVNWSSHASLSYFVVANAIAGTYSASSLVLLMVSQRRSITEFTLMQLSLLLLISDLIMVALLFSANGAAVAVAVIGIHGNSHTQWHKVCNMFKKYCQYSEASIVISMIGSFVFLSLVVLATLKLHKKSSW